MTTIENDEEESPLTSNPLDLRILNIVRNAKKDDLTGHRTIRPALLASELGLSVEEATRELCGLLSAVGGGEDGASFIFERVEMPPREDDGSVGVAGAAINATATTMVFTFPSDFDKRAQRYRRRSDLRQRLHSLTSALVKAIKIVTAFGLIISLAVLIIAGICMLAVAVIALARGGQGGGAHRSRPMMSRLRNLFLQLRQILFLYAICGSAVDGNRDPFMREVAGDVAFMLSIFCGNPLHPFFWFRAGGMRRRWTRVRHSRGWGGNTTWNDDNGNGVAMVRRGTWGEEQRANNQQRSSPLSSFQNSSSDEEQRGLLSIAVEFLFGPNNSDPTPVGNSNLPSSELEKWKFRASVIMTLSSTSQGKGVSLRELLPYADNPPASAADPSAIRETLGIVSYFNGKPVDVGSETSGDQFSGMDARFCFPEIVAEMDCQKLVTLGSSEFAPPMSFNNDRANLASILYKEEEYNFGSSANASNEIPEYLYERPFFLTELSRQQFGQCVLLGLLNFVGVIWVHSAMMPGGLLEIPVAATARTRSGSGPLIIFASLLVLKLLNILRFYAGLFFMLPLCRLAIVMIRNYGVEKRNKRRSNFVRAEL